MESALDKVRMIEDMGYDNLVVSIKSSDVLMCVRAHELLAPQCPYPLHVGITEAGTVYSGNIKSALGLGIILHEGIGDTIRVSLTGDPVNEIASAKLILRTLGLRKGGIEVVSCPTCGRTNIDLISLANEVEKMAAEFDHLNIKVAVMGCVVNGPGEAKEADIGIAGGVGEGLLIKKGEIVRKVPEKELLSTLRDTVERCVRQEDGMSLRIITGGSGQGKTQYVLEELIRLSEENPQQNCYMIVPEQFSLEMQRKLVESHPRHGYFQYRCAELLPPGLPGV